MCRLRRGARVDALVVDEIVAFWSRMRGRVRLLFRGTFSMARQWYVDCLLRWRVRRDAQMSDRFEFRNVRGSPMAGAMAWCRSDREERVNGQSVLRNCWRAWGTRNNIVDEISTVGDC